MGPYPLAELRAAFAHYLRVKERCCATRDWAPFAELFARDAYYVEHAYGEFYGRDEIRAYIEATMAPFPGMTFVEDWVVFDEERGAVVWQVQNVFPDPRDATSGAAFAFPNVSRAVYAGRDARGAPLFSEEQDWYNPSGVTRMNAAPTTRAWRRAGGEFAGPEAMRMMHDAHAPPPRASSAPTRAQPSASPSASAKPGGAKSKL